MFYRFSLVKRSATVLTETLFPIVKLIVYVEDRWPRLATAIRAVNFFLTVVHLHYGLVGLVAVGSANPALWTLVLLLLLYGLQGALVLLETIRFLVKELFRK